MDYSAMLDGLFSVEGLIGLFTLSILEIVLGIDNIIFISITADKLPKAKKAGARTMGLMLALVIRILLLFSITWIVGLKDPWFHLGYWGVTGRDLILLGGGVFLIVKTIKEIKDKLNGVEHDADAVEQEVVAGKRKKRVSVNAIIFQIVLIDFIFSFDSILTAVAISRNVLIMVAAVILSMIVMILFSGRVADFINENPRIKTMALGFLLVIGFVLFFESIKELTHFEVPKSYIYVALVFSIFIELLNMWEDKIAERKKNQ